MVMARGVDNEYLLHAPPLVPTQPLDEYLEPTPTPSMSCRTPDSFQGHDSNADQARAALLEYYPYLNEVSFNELVEQSMHIDTSLFDRVCATLVQNQVVREPGTSDARTWLKDDATELGAPKNSALGENRLEAIPSIITSILKAYTNTTQNTTTISMTSFTNRENMPDGDTSDSQKSDRGLQLEFEIWSSSEQREPAFRERSNDIQIVLPMVFTKHDTEGSRLYVRLSPTHYLGYTDVIPEPRQSGLYASPFNAKRSATPVLPCSHY